jgi:hypothetical protein
VERLRFAFTQHHIEEKNQEFFYLTGYIYREESMLNKLQFNRNISPKKDEDYLTIDEKAFQIKKTNKKKINFHH